MTNGERLVSDTKGGSNGSGRSLIGIDIEHDGDDWGRMNQPSLSSRVIGLPRDGIARTVVGWLKEEETWITLKTLRQE